MSRNSFSTDGWALLVVLGLLVAVSVLALTFLSSTRTGVVMSSAYSQSSESRMLVESVTNLVIGQMREATSRTNSTWITQPGLIRTFLPDGNPGKAYKLYSSNAMIVEGGIDPEALLATEVPAGWGDQPDDFFDLNRPVKMDGKWHYPILDPAAETVVAGFQNQADEKGITTGLSVPYPAMPMPVRWIYLLRDGSLAVRGEDGKIPGATRDNPPEARIAFWADDETCKINLNTASSGLFWDVPRGRGNDFEKGAFSTSGVPPVVGISGLASSPPGVREFNRYPGHPATTSLDVVLNNTNFFPNLTNSWERKKEILRYAPRVAFGGSELGTKFPLSSTPVTLDNDRLYASVDEYLYANDRSMNVKAGSIQDGITPAKLSLARFFLTTNSRSPEITLFNTPRVTIWPMPRDPADRTPFEKTLAFCSTVAGKEYLFTRGKFADGTLNLSSAVGYGGFTWVYFTGAGTVPALSQTLDFTAANADVYDYLYGLMDRNLPGYGKSLRDKFAEDAGEVLTLIYDYIRSTNLYDLSAPNSGPYTARPFILNELGSPDLVTLQPMPRPKWSGALTSDYSPSAYVGQVVPSRISRHGETTRGLGRFPVITGATVVIMATDPQDMTRKYSDWPGGTTRAAALYASFGKINLGSTLAAAGAVAAPGFANAVALSAQKMRAFVIFSLATPSAGPLIHNFTYEIEVSGLGSAELNGVNAGFPNLAVNRVIALDGVTKGTPMWTDGFTAAERVDAANKSYRVRFGKAALTPATGNNWFAYPFAGVPVDLSGGSVTFNGVLMDVTLKLDGQTLQTYRIELPAFTAPAPKWTNLTINTWGAKYMDTLADRLNISPANEPALPYCGDPNGGGVLVPTAVLPYDVDVVRSVELVNGDSRIIGGRTADSAPDVPATMYRKSKNYDVASVFQAQNLRLHPKGSWGQLVESSSPAITDTNILGELALPSRLVRAERSDGEPGDWDAGLPEINYTNQGRTEAGAFINKPDDCAMYFRGNNATTAAVPYFQAFEALAIEENAFTPNRIMPSPVMFGSLPVGVKRNLPWQTLLFRPNYPSHPGAANPPDHLLLDLFQMPVVEPYPISEPFSTDGKVNLNSQIAPFTYIKRNTGLRAVLDSVRIFANSSANPYLNALAANGTTFSYPSGTSVNAASQTNYRYPINADATLTLFEERFAQNRPFLTASGICEMFLVPKPETTAKSGVFPLTKTPFQTVLAPNASAAQVEAYVKNFWDTAGNATADNLRERPYAMIYPRVTARSNVFTVHFAVQSLKKSPNSPPDTFDSLAGDRVTGEYRGSVIIERFLDPNHAGFDPAAAGSQLGTYLFRVTHSREFKP